MAPSFAPSFANARPVAQHCAELIGTDRGPEELDQLIASWRRDLGQDLANELSQLFSGEKLHVSIAEPENLRGDEFFDRVGPIAVNCMLRCGEENQTLLLSLDFATAVALTDCSFGGEGEMPMDAPSQLPRSAGLLAEECGGLVAQTIARATKKGAGSGMKATRRIRGDVLVRSESVTRLKVFRGDEKIMVFRITMAKGAFSEWEMQLAIARDRIESLLPGNDAPRPNRRMTDNQVADGRGVFAQIPLPLEAVLGEFSLSLTELEKLSPGDEIPLSVPRDLPLRVGEKVLAHGVLGTLKNQLALKLTRLQGQGGTGAHNGQFAQAFTRERPGEPDGRSREAIAAQRDASKRAQARKQARLQGVVA